MTYRERKLYNIKRELYDIWLIVSRIPILVLFASSIISGMALILWIIAHLVNCILGV